MQEQLSRSQLFESSELPGFFHKMVSKILFWRQQYRTRRHLAQLPDYLLSDVGLDPQEARKEAEKPFWIK